MPQQTSARRALIDTISRGHITYRTESWANDGARHGISYLYPLLDKRIIEFVLGLPEHAFKDGQHSRLFYRQAMKSVLPDALLREHKPADFARINRSMVEFKAALREFAKRLESNSYRQDRTEYIDMERLSKALGDEMLDRREYLAKLIFAVQFLGLEEA